MYKMVGTERKSKGETGHQLSFLKRIFTKRGQYLLRLTFCIENVKKYLQK